VDVTAVFAIDACRTPVGKIKGSLAPVRPDHLTADVISALLARNPWLDPARIDDVYWGAANQAGEDNRNVARMGVLLAGLPVRPSTGCAGRAWRRSPAPPGRSLPVRPTSAWRAGWSR
jgi:acetyl-CoA acetyltransferase